LPAPTPSKQHCKGDEVNRAPHSAELPSSSPWLLVMVCILAKDQVVASSPAYLDHPPQPLSEYSGCYWIAPQSWRTKTWKIMWRRSKRDPSQFIKGGGLMRGGGGGIGLPITCPGVGPCMGIGTCCTAKAAISQAYPVSVADTRSASACDNMAMKYACLASGARVRAGTTTQCWGRALGFASGT
jgi:hypothetical protein